MGSGTTATTDVGAWLYIHLYNRLAASSSLTTPRLQSRGRGMFTISVWGELG